MIDEGQRQKIFWVSFSGNTIVSAAHLRRVVVSSKHPYFWLFSGEVDHKMIEEDVKKLTAYYRGLGFFKASVGRELEFNEGQTWCTLTFIIDEGPRYSVHNISVVGNERLSADRLSANFKLQPGDYFDQGKQSQDLNSIRDEYGGHGYVFAQIDPEIQYLDEPGKIDIVYNIKEGAIYHVGKIAFLIKGDNPHTQITTIMNRLSVKPGDLADTRKFRDDERRLKASGLFMNDPQKNITPKLVYSAPDSEDKDTAIAENPKTRTTYYTPFANVPLPPLPPGEQYVDLEFHAGEGSTQPAVNAAPSRDATPPAVNGPVTNGQPMIAPSAATPTPTSCRIPAPSPVTPEPVSPDLPCAPAPDGAVYPMDQLMVVRGQLPSNPNYNGSPYNGSQYNGSPQPQYAQQYQQPQGYGQPGYAQPAPAPQYAAPGQQYYSAGNFAPPGATAPANYYPPPSSNNNVYPAVGNAPANGPWQGGATYADGSAVTPQARPIVQTTNDDLLYMDRPGLSSDANPGFFPTPTGDPQRDLGLTAGVEEAQTGRLMFGVGVNSDAGLVGNVTLDEQNFDILRPPTSWDDIVDGHAWRGAGERLRIELAPGISVQRYMISFQEPYLEGSNVSFGVSGFYYERIYTEWTETRAGGRVSLGYQFLPDLQGSVSFQGQHVDIKDPEYPNAAYPFPVPSLQSALGYSELYTFSGELRYDKRDSPFLATQGYQVQGTLSETLGTYQYPSVALNVAKYFTLAERADGSGRQVLSLSAKGGYSGDDTPIFEKYYGGGFSSIRGFAFRGVTPRDPGSQMGVGGDFQLFTSAQYLFPITADDMLRGVVFCDAGTIEPKINDWDEKVRVAPGFGLRITIPMMGPAPIALDFAFPIVKQPGDQNQVFSFFVGLGGG